MDFSGLIRVSRVPGVTVHGLSPSSNNSFFKASLSLTGHHLVINRLQGGQEIKVRLYY